MAGLLSGSARSIHLGYSRPALIRQVGEAEVAGHFLLKSPVVICVAFKATGFCAGRSGMVALLTNPDAGQQNIGRILASSRPSVATLTGHQAVLVVVEHRMLEPPGSNPRFGDPG